MKHRSRKEIADIVLRLKNNLDESEQFENYVNELIRHCEKSYLLSIIPCLCESVEYNLELYNRGYIEKSCICDCPDKLEEFIKEIREEIE